MSILLGLLLCASPELVRTAESTTVQIVHSGPVWVYFTDKGLFNDADYRTALQTFSDRTRDCVRERRLRTTGGFDFTDLPVRGIYVREIEAMGARLRRVSNWLNAASFDMPAPLSQLVSRLPFVYAVRQVASRTTDAADFAPMVRPSDFTGSRTSDTAATHRFYGPSYDQAQLMGVPEALAVGLYGSGVRLAIFDTGLKLKNVAVNRLKLFRQHDFLSGDNCYSARSAAWTPTSVESIRFQGLVRDPALATVQMPSGSQDSLILVFVADSFAYGYNAPKRALFACYSTDAGTSWSSPTPIATTVPYDNTFENLCLASHGFVTYLGYNSLKADNPSPAGAAVGLGYFVGTSWQTWSGIGSGRYPSLDVLADTLYLAFVRDDSTLVLWKGSAVLPEPTRLLETSIVTRDAHNSVAVCAAGAGATDIFASSRNSGALVRYHSSDGGTTFSAPETLSLSGTSRLRLLKDGQTAFLFCTRTPGLSDSLLVYRSDDGGATWPTTAHTVLAGPAVGGYAACLNTDALDVLFEEGGLIQRVTSSDMGSTWSTPAVLDSSGFDYWPTLAQTGQSTIGLWFKRGDDNVVWDNSDTVRFSREQCDHGTRMASIISGYQQGALVGVAPGVDLIVAKTELYKVRSGRYYEYNMEEDTYIEALEWAERVGADIISTSLGYRAWYGDSQFDGKTAPISVAASLAARRGLIVVTAMGNRSADSTHYPWPVPYIVAPGDADGVITAGGVEKNLSPWRGTGTGPTSDGRVKPDLVALSDTVAVASPDSVNYLDGSVGTSCATALVAGVCALLKEAHPGWDADSIKAVLFSTATRSVKSCTFGFGVPRIDSALKLYPPDTTVPPATEDRIGLVFPDPFVTGSQARVYFQLDIAHPATKASISIYTASGRLVDTVSLNAGQMPRPARYGDHGDILTLDRIGAFWDGKNWQDKPAASGLYIAVLRTTYASHATRFALVR